MQATIYAYWVSLPTKLGAAAIALASLFATLKPATANAWIAWLMTPEQTQILGWVGLALFVAWLIGLLLLRPKASSELRETGPTATASGDNSPAVAAGHMRDVHFHPPATPTPPLRRISVADAIAATKAALRDLPFFGLGEARLSEEGLVQFYAGHLRSQMPTADLSLANEDGLDADQVDAAIMRLRAAHPKPDHRGIISDSSHGVTVKGGKFNSGLSIHSNYGTANITGNEFHTTHVTGAPRFEVTDEVIESVVSQLKRNQPVMFVWLTQGRTPEEAEKLRAAILARGFIDGGYLAGDSFPDYKVREPVKVFPDGLPQGNPNQTVYIDVSLDERHRSKHPLRPPPGCDGERAPPYRESA